MSTMKFYDVLTLAIQTLYLSIEENYHMLLFVELIGIMSTI